MPHDRPSSRRGPALANILMILTLTASLTACALLIWERSPASGRAQADRAVTPRGAFGPGEQATVDLFRRASPSVVHIQTPGGVDPFRGSRSPEGTGTGFLWDAEGHVVTNYHVVRDLQEVLVIFQDNSVVRARVVGREPSRDLAVLELAAPAKALEPLPLGTSHDLQVGQTVHAIGNPFGYDQTLTTGIVSALGREITSLMGTQIWDVIQTDAAINPGNSGGPLLDSAGRLIGVNTAIYSPSGASSGIGFALPVDSVRRVVPDLIRFGRFNRPVFGFQPVPSGYRERLGLSGVLVAKVARASAAERAGFRETYISDGKLVLGDLIVAVNDKEVTSRVDLDRFMDEYRVGDEVEVTLEREGQRRTVKVRLQSVTD